MGLQENYLEILTKLLSADVYSTKYDEILTTIKNIINKDYSNAVNEGDCPFKITTLEEIRDVVSNVELFIKYPFFIGKTIVGILNGDLKLRKKYLNDVIILEKQYNTILNNTFVPIIYNDNTIESLNIVNKFGRFEEINDNDLKKISLELRKKYNTDVSQVLEGIIVEEKCRYKDISFIDFNIFSAKNENYKTLMKSAEILIYNIDKYSKIQGTINFINEIDYKGKVIFVEREHGNNKELSSDIVNYISKSCKFNYEIISDETELCEVIEKNNKKKNNIDFIERIKQSLLSVQAYHQMKADDNNLLIEKINKHIIIEDSNKDDEICNVKESLSEDLKLNYKVIKGIEIVKNKLITELVKINKMLEEDYKNINNISFNTIKTHKENYNNIEYGIIDSLIVLGCLKDIDNRIEKLINNNFPKGNILKVKLALKRGVNIPPSSIAYIKGYTGEDEDILRAKVNYRDSLGISEAVAKKYA